MHDSKAMHICDFEAYRSIYDFEAQVNIYVWKMGLYMILKQMLIYIWFWSQGLYKVEQYNPSNDAAA